MLYLTRRTIWGGIGKLRRGHLIHTKKEDREHRYEVGDMLLRQTLFALVRYEKAEVT